MIQNRIKNNRTVKYLGPLHVLYGKTFLREIDNLTNYVPAKSGSSIIDFTIMDLLYYRAKRFKKFQPFLFITFDSYMPTFRPCIDAPSWQSLRPLVVYPDHELRMLQKRYRTFGRCTLF